jgi:hypothetical protein
LCASAEKFVQEIVKKALTLSEVGNKRRQKIDSEHIIQALEEFGAGHLCAEVREAADIEAQDNDEKGSRRKAKRKKLSAEELDALGKEQEASLETARKSAIGN